MSKSKKGASAPAAVDTTTEVAVADTATATDTSDAAVGAALALIDAQLAGEVPVIIADTDQEPTEGTDVTPTEEPETIVGDVEGIEVEAMDVAEVDPEAVLAELEADAATSTAETKPKRGRKAATKAAGTTTTKEPVVKREFHAVAAIDEATLKANLAALNAKKVHEKAQNLTEAIVSGKKLSGYTKTALTILRDTGRISSKTLVDAFLAAGMSEGTARAQAQQQTALLPVFGIAARSDATAPRDLVIQDNALVDELLAAA